MWSQVISGGFVLGYVGCIWFYGGRWMVAGLCEWDGGMEFFGWVVF